ncbi:MAG: hypothetical protein ACI4PG_08490 [Candidatus Ventricola sp.]
MKKCFAMLLAALMLLSCGLAEDQADEVMTDENAVYIDFDIRMDKLPEGYTYYTEEAGGSLFAVFYKEDERHEADKTAPAIYVSVAHADDFSGITLNMDVSDEQLLEIEEKLAADYNDPSIEIRQTDYGTKVICITENDAQTDYADLLTIWNGYFITVGLQKTEQIVDEDMDLALQIVSDLWIVER